MQDVSWGRCSHECEGTPTSEAGDAKKKQVQRVALHRHNYFTCGSRLPDVMVGAPEIAIALLHKSPIA